MDFLTDGLEPLVAEGWQSFYLIKNVSKMFGYTVLWGSGCIASLIPNLGTVWRRMFNFTPRTIHPRQRQRYTLNRRMTGLQNLYGRFWRRKKSSRTPGIRSPDPAARGNSLYQLLVRYAGSQNKINCVGYNYFNLNCQRRLQSCFYTDPERNHDDEQRMR